MLPVLPKGYLEQQLENQAVERLQSTEDARKSNAGRKVPQDLRRAAFSQAARFRLEHGRVDRVTGERLARAFLSGITPRRTPGAKPSKLTLKATELLESGESWSGIYPLIWPNYPKWPKDRQQRYARTLRRNVNRLRKKQGLESLVPRGRPRKATD